ncbi:hypothetical protein CHU95_11875 [Niveispirillum lacus]|uniref:Dihydroneopterin aldolase/epimerase domain-containing protein n=1 Tax=Niveispirillum lacus TaxID=1981099 RepID=A0A255YY38_9PROT|nr:hypothetical protein [Niveispirillum lacus]OYQ34153.1 hypothetical protein CHU95_11875 [Niveispirillum lacus]
MIPSPHFQILVREVAVALPVGGRTTDLDVRVNLRLGTSVTGPFTGDPDDINLTVDYSCIVRHILGPFRDEGPFVDADTLARTLGRFIFAFDGRILTQRIGIHSPADPGFTCQIELERD